MLEVLQNVGGMAQSFGMCQNKKIISIKIVSVSMKLIGGHAVHHQLG